ncbi:MAG: cytochrome c [Sediminibacterium sp.]|nr:cytochrome c [Sediminibacterium sp.]
MDFPMFHLDWLNDRFLIAMIAILHVIINHGLAVGFIPFVTWLEQKGVKNSSSDQVTDSEWDKMAYKLMWTAFIITTTIGAMTGVGIWFSAALVSPSSIGSLIRVFYWAWFTEWVVFVTEVVLILIYFLTWKSSNRSLNAKLKHIRFGWFLAIFSWITMAIIVAILGFMMDPGNWQTERSLLSGIFNPIYLPQLFFRTPTAMVVGGTFGLMMIMLFTKKGSDVRNKAVRAAGKWILIWSPLALVAAINYYHVMPSAMQANMSTAIGTMEFEQYYTVLKYLIPLAICVVLIVALWAVIKTTRFKAYMALSAVIAIMAFLAIFERVREFVRKPYVIGNYMYSNLLRIEDYPLYKKDGILKHATYTSVHEITDNTKVEAGKNIFMLTCSRCHTTNGVNSITYVFERMYGAGKPLNEDDMEAYIPNMHEGRKYMPPFPGNKKELRALVAYIKHLQQTGEVLEGAQSSGVVINPDNSTTSVANHIEAEKRKTENKLVQKK